MLCIAALCWRHAYFGQQIADLFAINLEVRRPNQVLLTFFALGYCIKDVLERLGYNPTQLWHVPNPCRRGCRAHLTFVSGGCGAA